MALGRWPEVSEKEAGAAHAAGRQLLRLGVDPMERRRQTKAQARFNANSTFELVAKAWIREQKAHWSVNSLDKIERRLVKNVYPWLGSRSCKISIPIRSVSPLPNFLTATEPTGAVADLTDSARGAHIRHLVAPRVETSGYFVAKTEMPPFGKAGLPAWNGTLTRCVVLSIATEWEPLPAATV